MTDIGKKEEVVQAYPVNYIIPTQEDEIELLDLWRALVAHKKYFIIGLFFALVVGIFGVASFYQPKYSVSSMIDVGPLMTDSEDVFETFLETLVGKIEVEKIRLVLSDSFFDQTRQNLSGTDTRLKKKTSLINISNKVLPGSRDAAVEFHRRLVTAVMEDLHNSYRLFNLEENNSLLSIKSQLNSLESGLYYQEAAESGKRIRIVDEDFLNRETEILEQAAANLEAALAVAGPVVISLADVSSSPVGLTPKTAYALVFIFSLFFAFFVVILVVIIQKMRQRLAEED